MKIKIMFGTALLALCCSAAVADSNLVSNPLNQVLDLIQSLRSKIKDEGNAQRTIYRKFKGWCDESENDAHFEVVTASKRSEKLSAQISKLTSDIETSTSTIEQNAGDLSNHESELKRLAEVRTKDKEEFTKGETELMSMVDSLDRAMTALEEKKDTALTQVGTQNVNNVVHALGVVLDAASVRTSDRTKLLAMVQSTNKVSEDADEEADNTAAPQAAAYQSKSGSIVDIIEDLKDKTELGLADLRKNERESQHNYEVLAQSLRQQQAQDKKGMADQKHARSKATEELAVAQGDSEVVINALREATKEHQTLQDKCLESASQYEVSTASRDKELDVLWKAITIIKEAARKPPTFLQVATTATMSSSSRVVDEVQRLAKEEHSTALAQLASRIASVIRHGGASGQDSFGKVKDMLKDMIKKTEREAAADATEKEYCDKELEKTGLKEEDLTQDVHHLRAQVNTDKSKLTSIKQDIKHVSGELATIAKRQADSNHIRDDQTREYVEEKTEITTGLEGVDQALKVLRSYYDNHGGDDTDDGKFAALMQQPAQPQQHESRNDAGAQIIAMLEGIREDLSGEVSALDSTEERQKEAYEEMTGENKLEVVSFEENMAFSGTQKKKLGSELVENQEEQETFNSELSAVDEYLIKLKKRCQTKVDAFEERARRKRERVAGLEAALKILDEELAAPAFIQRLRSHRVLRGNLALDVAAMQ